MLQTIFMQAALAASWDPFPFFFSASNFLARAVADWSFEGNEKMSF
jgi:hypothetical protein